MKSNYGERWDTSGAIGSARNMSSVWQRSHRANEDDNGDLGLQEILQSLHWVMVGVISDIKGS